MIAEPVALPLEDGNFITAGTATVVIGECRCPGRPHGEDTADVLLELPWDVLVDVGLLSGGAAYRALVYGALVGWNLTDADGDPVPVTRDAVGRMRQERLDPIAAAVNEAYERATAPLPNTSGARSRPSRPASASPNPTIRPRAKATRSR